MNEEKKVSRQIAEQGPFCRICGKKADRAGGFDRYVCANRDCSEYGLSKPEYEFDDE